MPALVVAAIASLALALPAETSTQKTCPEGAMRLEHGGCAIPALDALMATAECDSGEASYAGSCWELSERALERFRARARTDGLRPERDGCVSGTVRIGERCVPISERQSPREYARTVASGRGECRANCAPGTVCAGDQCLRATLTAGRGHWCGESPHGTFDEKNCRGCYQGIWYPACDTAGDACSCE